EKQKAFAGEKVPSMHRRMVGHDYQERQMYMITMVTEGRCPLLGQVVGRSDGQTGSPDEPRTEPSELGRRVEQCWHEIALRYPQIEVLAFQLMPDHFHGILFVKEHIEKPLGKVLLGFKQGCNKAFRALVPSVPSVAVLQQQTKQPQTKQQQTREVSKTLTPKCLIIRQSASARVKDLGGFVFMA
nr:transposase [Prevotella sp.]